MSGGYTPGSITAGFKGTTTISGTKNNGTLTIGTVPAGKTWYILTLTLTADNTSQTCSALVAGTTIMKLYVNASNGRLQLVMPAGTAIVATAGQTVQVQADLNPTATLSVEYYEV